MRVHEHSARKTRIEQNGYATGQGFGIARTAALALANKQTATVIKKMEVLPLLKEANIRTSIVPCGVFRMRGAANGRPPPGATDTGQQSVLSVD
jgi:hypothetical protein